MTCFSVKVWIYSFTFSMTSCWLCGDKEADISVTVTKGYLKTERKMCHDCFRSWDIMNNCRDFDCKSPMHEDPNELCKRAVDVIFAAVPTIVQGWK